LRQKDDEQNQQGAVDQIVLAQPTAAVPNQMRNASVNRIVIAAPTVGPSGT
jgi:hypothetical protein